MAVNPDNARIFGNDKDAIYLAPLGTPLPTSIDGALSAAFEDVGWLHSDGITETFSGSRSEIRGHQGQKVVRTRIETPGTSIGFHALESKPLTKKLRYDEKSVDVTNGVRKVRRGSGQKVTAMTAVIDIFDADDVTVKERHCIERFEITPDGDRVYAGSDIAGFPFRGEIVGDYDTYEAVGPLASEEWDLTVSGSPTGGTYKLQVNGFWTAGIAHNANTTAIAAAINALSGVTGISGVSASGSVKITFPVPVVLAADGGELTGGTTPDVTVAPAAS